MLWTNRPTNTDQSEAYRLLRVPAKQPIVAIITSHDVIGTETHYWRGRTRPHLPTDCEACKAGSHPRWHGYLSVIGQKTGEHAILELTPTAITAIERWIAEHGSLRGATITASRLGNKPNGRILIQLKPTLDQARELPQPLDLKRALERLWQWSPQPEPPTEPQKQAHPKHSNRIGANGNGATSKP